MAVRGKIVSGARLLWLALVVNSLPRLQRRKTADAWVRWVLAPLDRP